MRRSSSGRSNVPPETWRKTIEGVRVVVWAVRYLVVDTSNWWVGKKVLVAPQWALGVRWDERKVHVALSRQAIKLSPEWDPGRPINREYESRLYDCYGRPAYWDSGAPPIAAPPIAAPSSREGRRL